MRIGLTALVAGEGPTRAGFPLAFSPRMMRTFDGRPLAVRSLMEFEVIQLRKCLTAPVAGIASSCR